MVRTKSGAHKRNFDAHLLGIQEEDENALLFKAESHAMRNYEEYSDGEADCQANAEGDEVDGDDHIEVEINAAETLATHFGNISGEDGDGESEDSGDEYWKDDVIPEPLLDDDEDAEERQKSPELEMREEGEDWMLKLGKCFSSATDFKHYVLRYSLKAGFDIKLYISNMKKLGAVYSNKEMKCPWQVYCSYEKRKRKLQIKVYELKHTCIRSCFSNLLKSSTIVELFEDKLWVNPKFKSVEMAEEISYNLIVIVDECRKAKSILSKVRRKEHELQFGKIWDYEAELHKSNQGTTIDIETTPGSTQRFYRMYICFESQRTSWTRYGRPIIGLDEAFLKWDVKGQLIASVGRDGDSRIFPIAWAVVEIENDTNWDWFLTHLKRDLGLGDDLNYTVISDKQKGLVSAVKTSFHKLSIERVLDTFLTIGRPSNYSRRKSVGETSSKTKLSQAKRIMTCSNYKEEGHNKKGCKNASVQPIPKRSRGRPKKYQVHKLILK